MHHLLFWSPLGLRVTDELCRCRQMRPTGTLIDYQTSDSFSLVKHPIVISALKHVCISLHKVRQFLNLLLMFCIRCNNPFLSCCFGVFFVDVPDDLVTLEVQFKFLNLHDQSSVQNVLETIITELLQKRPNQLPANLLENQQEVDKYAIFSRFFWRTVNTTRSCENLLALWNDRLIYFNCLLPQNRRKC